jgi:TldD protein
MSQILELAQSKIWEPAGLAQRDLDKLFSRLTGPDVDYADIYFQHSRQEAWSLEEGIVKSGSYSIEQGVGIRAISGEKTGFAYSDELRFPALAQAAGAARAITAQGQSGSVSVSARRDNGAPMLYSTEDPLSTLRDEEKVQLLERTEQEARQQDPRVSEVMASLVAVHDVVLVARSDGRLAADIRPLVRLNISVIVTDGDRREQGSAGGGGRYGLDHFSNDMVREYAHEAVRQALVNLDAVDAPAGSMTVVLGPGWPGVLLHEAIGHGLEGDFNRKGTSAFSGRMGEQVATEQCTVVDDGTLPNLRGSLSVDDEGTQTRQTVLIEDGVLRGYMQDTHNARLMGMEPTGNGRRESFAHLPMPRMTNTYMLAGKYDPEEILSSVDKGIYAVNFSGGQVDITSGKFVFSASEAYLVDGGKVTTPVRGATLIGNGPDVLTRVGMVGNDLKLDTGVGTCGKDGQQVPVGVGQPTMRIDGLTVGGVQV